MVLTAAHVWRRRALRAGLPGLQFGVSPSPGTCVPNYAVALRTPKFYSLGEGEPAELASLNLMRAVDEHAVLPNEKSLQGNHRKSTFSVIEGFGGEFSNLSKNSERWFRPSENAERGGYHGMGGYTTYKSNDAYRLHSRLPLDLNDPERHLNLPRIELYIAPNGGIDRPHQRSDQTPETNMGRLAGRPNSKWLDLLAQVSAAWLQRRSKKPCAVCRPVHPVIQQENRSLSSLTRKPSTALARPYLPERLPRVPGEIGLSSERIDLRDTPPTFASN